MEVGYLDLVGEGYMGSMQWQLGREMGTIPAFASRTQENQENLGRDGNYTKISLREVGLACVWWLHFVSPSGKLPI